MTSRGGESSGQGPGGGGNPGRRKRAPGSTPRPYNSDSPRPRRGPVALGDALGHLFASKGLARPMAAGELERAWVAAVGETDAAQTRLGTVRHGVLTINVAHPTLLGELAAFRKPALLAALRKHAPGSAIQDLRFRVGPVD